VSMSSVPSIRACAITGIVGASVTAAGGVLVQSAVQPYTSVSDKLWSYPWSSSALVPVSILWALAHLLVIVGLVGFRRSAMAGPGRAAARGIDLAVIGTVSLFAGELASVLVRHSRTNDTSAQVVGMLFGLGLALSAVGFVVAGVSTMRHGHWAGWRRTVPLATGICTVALVVVSFTKALPTGVAAYGVCLLALNVAVDTWPAPTTEVPSTVHTQLPSRDRTGLISAEAAR
jgi:hypothetical protein